MKYIIFSLLLILLLIGCDPVEYSPKEEIQKKLIHELYYCEQKFGSNDYDDKLEANVDYCNKILLLVERKIDEGFFSNSTAVFRAVTEAKEFVNDSTIKEEIPAEESIEDIYDSIAGDI
jgi:hypothetical protein